MELALGTGAGWSCGGGGEPCPADQTLSPSKTNPTLEAAAADSSPHPPGGGGC